MLTLFSTACIEQIDLVYPTQQRAFIVEGMLGDTREFQYVAIKVHLPEENGMSEANGAAVFLDTDDDGSITFSESEAGVYRPSERIRIYDGEKYRIRITVGDSVEQRSEWQHVPPKIEIASTSFRITTKMAINDNGYLVPAHGISYYVSSKPAYASNVYIRYGYMNAYIMRSPFSSPLCSECTNCYIVANAKNQVTTASIENAIGKSLTNVEVAFIEPRQESSIKNTIRILQFSVNKDVYDYYSAIERQKNLRGTVFDPPPAVLESNVKSIGNDRQVVYGFFEVARVAEASVYVSRNDIPFHVRTFEEACGPNSPRCRDCRVMEGATHNRPSWF